MPIVSLLDNDFYKFTMMQCVFHQFPEASVEYELFFRKKIENPARVKAVMHQTFEALSSLRLSQEEYHYLKSFPFFKNDFLNYLKNFSFNPEHIIIDKNDRLRIKGPWLATILFEVPLLALLSEQYFSKTHTPSVIKEGERRLQEKIETIHQHPLKAHFRLTDFGTRRRYSQAWHETVVKTFSEQCPQQFTGTSNVHLARRFNVKPIGTMAHEFVQAMQALAPNLEDSQRHAFSIWLKEYQGELAIALSDTLGLPQFLKDFDLTLAHAYQGARQDSGDPVAWTQTLLRHYKKLGIDPKTKHLVYSDALTIDKALAIMAKFYTDASLLFGIGTHLTHDLGLRPLDMVIKLVKCNNRPVAKLSDSPGKETCLDADYLNTLKSLIVR